MSEVAGRSTLIERIQKVDASVRREDEVTTRIINQVKEMEHQGYQFEGADATLEMLIRKQLGQYRPFFPRGKVQDDRRAAGRRRDGLCCGDGKGCRRRSGRDECSGRKRSSQRFGLCFTKSAGAVLSLVYRTVHLTDYKVRVLDSSNRTASKVRVLIETTDGKESWTTVGVSVDIIEASLIALIASIEYKLIHTSV